MKKKQSIQKDKKVLFKTQSSNLKKIQKQRKYSSVKNKINVKKLFIILIPIFIITGVILLFQKFDRKEKSTIEVEIPTVLGLEDIPAFPYSRFLYESSKEEQAVKDMLANGQSAYVITDDKDFDDVKEFYINDLNSRGWTLVLDVAIGSEDKKYGQYWINSERGLRIYSKYKDIWYEYITIEEAQNGLSNRVSNEIEIDMLLAGSDYQELLPDYPWQIKIPKDYLIRYEVSEFEDLRAVNFQRISTGSNITIYPIGYWGSKALDLQLDDYIEILNTDDQEWRVLNTIVNSFQNSSSLSGVISSDSKQKDVFMLKNGKNFVTYVMSSEDKSDPLYMYILENIKYLGQE